MSAISDDTPELIEQSLTEIDWAALTTGRTFHPSPVTWEDELLYFLFVDRFSDGKEFGGFADIRGLPEAGPTATRQTPLDNGME